nr:GNAT family N-acetyltransferase [Deltaproteobacteria bacterium]
MTELSTLTMTDYQEYSLFIQRLAHSMYYASTDFKDILEHEFEMKSSYGILRLDGRIIGAIPCFIKDNESHGAVLNSLPFFGSNGGLVMDPDYDTPEHRSLLINYLLNVSNTFGCISTVVITSPFETNHDVYRNHFCPDLMDYRIGQITELKSDNISAFSNMRVRGIKKAIKSGVRLRIADCASPEELELFHEMHHSNMIRIGGVIKPFTFLQKINASPYSRFLWAELDGQIIAGLLCLFFNKTVEYYIPVFDEDHKNLHGLSLAIWHGMDEAFREGYRYWNFGGTWLSQEGVYTFKDNFGTQDFPYTYYVKLDRDIDFFRSLGRQKLTEE